MSRLLQLLVTAVLLTIVSPVAAQDGDEAAQSEASWDGPLQGFGETLFAGRSGLGFLLVTPVDDEPTQKVEQLIRQKLVDSGLAELVMDDSPLGDLDGKSDDEIIASARKYPVDVVLLLRTFPGPDGPTAVLRVETTEQAESQSFRFSRGQKPPWKKRPKPTPPPTDEPGAVATSQAIDFAREHAAMTRMGAVGVVATLNLIEGARQRRILDIESDPNSPVVRDHRGEVLPWPKPYQVVGRHDLARKYQRRKITRNATIVTGGVLAAAGIGLLFVGLANQANCAGDPGCGRPSLIIGGISGIGVGAIAVTTGLILRPHPINGAEIETLLERHNTRLNDENHRGKTSRSTARQPEE